MVSQLMLYSVLLYYTSRYSVVGISQSVRVIFGINNVTVMMHTKIIILIDVASVPSGLASCKIVLCVGVVVTI